MKALVIDLGGSHATCGIVEDRNILVSKVVHANGSGGLLELLPSIAEALRALSYECGVPISDCAGLSAGFPGLVDCRAGRVVSTNAKYEDAPKLDLPAWGRETFGLPLRVENDARLALLGEVYAGAAQGQTEVVMVTLGTGIGGVAMVEGRLLRGKHAQAGCLGGHIPVLFSGRQCTCGNIGCAEAEAGGWSLPLVVKEWPRVDSSSIAKIPNIGFKELFGLANQGDAIALAIRDRCLKVWCADVVALIHAYDPELVVMGGGAMKNAEVIIPAIQDHVNKYAWTPWGKVQIRAAKLGNEAALVGAIPLLQETFS